MGKQRGRELYWLTKFLALHNLLQVSEKSTLNETKSSFQIFLEGGLSDLTPVDV